MARHLGKQRTSKEYRTHWKQTVRPNLQVTDPHAFVISLSKASVANLTASLSKAARKRDSSTDAGKPEKRVKSNYITNYLLLSLYQMKCRLGKATLKHYQR